MSLPLSHRLSTLNETYKSTLTLITQLQTLDPSLPDAEQQRLSLASEIHDSLKDQEDTLSLLHQELDDDTYPPRRRAYSNGAEAERERNADLIARLTEDLRSARGRFRRAQLQAKKNADDAKRKEREALFRRREERGERPASRNAGRNQEKLTQEELAKNASEDVTRALRRAHDLLSTNLSQSQFAQQTLDESQDALKGLSESYGGTGDLLKASRGLVGQLVRSNKSDTWYLQTSFYMLAVTLVWLVFRRWFYGPLWWLVWLPLRFGWKGAGFLIGAGQVGRESGAVGGKVTGIGMEGVPRNPSGMVFKSMGLPAKGGGWGSQNRPEGEEQVKKVGKEETMVEKVGRIVDEVEERIVDVDDLTEDERRRQEEQPRNPKKRMMEVEVESDTRKDEL